jgi:hypothetical protein
MVVWIAFLPNLTQLSDIITPVLVLSSDSITIQVSYTGHTQKMVRFQK